MAAKAREFRLSLGNTFLSLKADMEERKTSTDPDSLRHTLERWLGRLWVQAAIVVLVMLDLLLVTTLLLMDLNVIQAPAASTPVPSANSSTPSNSGDESPSPAENAIHIINIILLFVFFTEIILRVVAHGLNIIKDHWQVFDGVVVVGTTLFYVILTAARVDRTATYVIGYFIALRLWRVHRIHQGICEREKRRAERIINVHRKARSEAEEQVKELEVRLEKSERELLQLQCHLRQSHRFSSDQRTLPDGERSLASEDEGEWPRESVETIQVELSTTGGSKHPANGAVLSHTPPHGSQHSLHIGTPTSTGSFADLGHSPNSDRASAKSYPDLVEHTPGMDSGQTEGISYPQNEAMDMETGHPSRGVTNQESVDGHGEERAPVNGNGYETHHTHAGQSQVSPKFTNYRKKEKKKLLRERERGDLSYVNASFDGNLSQEEVLEIKRISQVPFDSTTCLNNVGVPMTDL